MQSYASKILWSTKWFLVVAHNERAAMVPDLAMFFTLDGQNAVHFRNACTFPKCMTDNKKCVMMSFRYVLSNRNASFTTKLQAKKALPWPVPCNRRESIPVTLRYPLIVSSRCKLQSRNGLLMKDRSLKELIYQKENINHWKWMFFIF